MKRAFQLLIPLSAVAFMSLAGARAFAQVAQPLAGGPAVHFGVAAPYGAGLGVAVEYQVRVKPRLWLTPFASLDMTSATGDEVLWGPGYAAGVQVEVGESRRLFVAPLFGSLGLGLTCDTAGSCTNRGTLLGPSLLVGYKRIRPGGLLWFVSGGVSYTLNDSADPRERYFGPAAGLGIGYKF